MPRLLIQCQGSPGPLSFKLTQDKVVAVMHHYHNYPQRHVIPIENDKGELYCIDMALVSWICEIDESEPESETDPEHTRIPTRVL